MKSFQERFCDEHHCGADEFPQKVFWRCLHRHALLLAPLVGGFGSRYFTPDRELILCAGRAVHMSEVREEVRHFFTAPANQQRLRRDAKLRLSGKRLMLLAGQYLPGSGSLPPF